MLELTYREPPSPAEPLNLSVSAIRVFQACPRKYEYKYCYSIEGKEPPDEKQAFGTAFHKAIELNIAKPPSDWSVAEATLGLDIDQGALVAGTVAAYGLYWGGELTYRAAELELTAGLRNPRIRLLAIVDGLAENSAGRTVLVEHKTTESDLRPGGWYWEKLVLDQQASAYLWAAAQNGIHPDEVVWDAIKRPKLERRVMAIPPEYYARAGKYGKAGDVKPGTGLPAETPTEFACRVRDTIMQAPSVYFQRAPVVRMQDEIEAAVTDMEAIGEQILASWDRRRFPRNPSSCLAYGRKCEYWNVCAGGTTLADDTLFQVRTKRETVPKKNIGSSFDEFLREEGIADEVRAAALAEVANGTP
jgi:hypothetical protein